MLKFPRTIRLDPSDTFVFERAAEPGEWAVSGAFVFWNRDPATLGQKQRVALRSGFLGIDSLGWSTLAIVTEATEAERETMIERLAGQLMEKFGAPDSDGRAPCRRGGDRVRRPRCASIRRRRCLPCSAASKTAKSANAFALSKPRPVAADADRLHAHASAFTFHEVEGDVEPAEEVDLLGLIRTDRQDDGSHMREFWVASGHHLTRRADHGGLVATPELIMAYLARPELMPPADACDAERDLHASLMADPLRAGVGRGHRRGSPMPTRAKTGPS